MENVMKSWGFDITIANNGQDGLLAMHKAMVEGKLFSLIMLDLQMPVMDGFAFAKEVRSNPKWHDVKMIMMSSVAELDILNRSKKIGINDYLNKPLRQADLLQKVMHTLQKAEYDESSDHSSTQKSEALKGLNILLAEDNIVNQKVAVNLLKKWGHLVTIANDGVETIRILEEGDFDLILMDIEMPNMDGVQTTAAIRNSTSPNIKPDIPIIAVTAHAIKGDKERFLDAQMDDYISKPLNIDEFYTVIRKFNFKENGEEIKTVDNG